MATSRATSAKNSAPKSNRFEREKRIKSVKTDNRKPKYKPNYLDMD